MLVYMPLPEDLRIKTGNCRRPEGREQPKIECQTQQYFWSYMLIILSKELLRGSTMLDPSLLLHCSAPTRPHQSILHSLASLNPKPPLSPSNSPSPQASREKKKIPIALLCKANCPFLVFNLSLLGEASGLICAYSNKKFPKQKEFGAWFSHLKD